MEVQKYYGDLEPTEQKRIDNYIFHQLDMLIGVGDYLISNRDGSAYKVINIAFVQVKKWKQNNREEYDVVEEIRLYYKNGSIEEHQLGGYSVWKGSLENLEKEALHLSIHGEPKPISKKSSGNELMSFDKEAFSLLKEDLVLRTQSMQAKAKYAEALLRQKLWALDEILEPLLKEVKRIKTIIWTIELYLGIKEDIVQIQSGNEASLDEPINLMQERLYMDEEFGDPSNEGLDWKSIDQFYDWLLSHSDYFGHPYYELLLPYEKCVRIMRVRREGKNYGDPFLNMRLNELNFETTILIRNGENIYTIETDMVFGERLFPAETELMDLQNSIIEKSKNVISRNGRKMDDDYLNEILDEKMTSETDRYKRNLIIIQGLIDRTEVFGKLFGRVNLMDGSAINKGQIVFHYDCDLSNIIGDGDKTYLQKIKEVIKNIDHGSRIIQIISRTYKYPSDDFINIWRRHDSLYPRYPISGQVHTLLKHKQKDRLYFMYLPDEEIWTEENGYHQRKNKVAFAPVIDETTTADVDAFSHRDIAYLEKMMYDRRQRRNYLKYMDILKLLVKFKKKELEEEKPFAQLVMSQCGVSEMEALDTIFWWKTKNKYKRSLKADDSKALRMIKRYFKTQNNVKK